MTQHFLFAKPTFTARVVAKVIGQRLNRKLAFKEADDDEDVDGEIDITNRIHIQVGADYLVVCAWKDEFTLTSWPARPNIPYAWKDLLAAMNEFPEQNETQPAFMEEV